MCPRGLCGEGRRTREVEIEANIVIHLEEAESGRSPVYVWFNKHVRDEMEDNQYYYVPGLLNPKGKQALCPLEWSTDVLGARLPVRFPEHGFAKRHHATYHSESNT